MDYGDKFALLIDEVEHLAEKDRAGGVGASFADREEIESQNHGHYFDQMYS